LARDTKQSKTKKSQRPTCINLKSNIFNLQSSILNPMLFFAGTRDSLCDLAALTKVLERLSANWQLEIVEGGDHSFRVPKSAGVTQEEIYRVILQKTVAWLKA
jgi:dienelactone hydrolase